LEDTTVDPADHNPNPERALIDRSRQQQLRDAINRLAPEYRETLILRDIEGLAYKEIAALQDIPIGTVMSRLARARDVLTAQMIPDSEERR
jgi:RNA polymerase sigma-70 factor (ECF subfamily)